MVDLGGYVIILVETKDKKVKLYGSPAEKADLEVADEILEINGESLENSTHTDVIAHIHKCIKSRTICLRVKRRTGNKLALELSENSHVQDAFVIAVEQQAKERLERLSALRKITPVDMTKLSQQLCESPPLSSASTNHVVQVEPHPHPIYSAPVSELGSTANLNKMCKDDVTSTRNNKHNRKNNEADSGGGYLTDEELELTQTIEDESNKPRVKDLPKSKLISGTLDSGGPESLHSPSKEVLIADNSSRRSSKASIQNGSNLNNIGSANTNNNGHHHAMSKADRKTSIKNGHQSQLQLVQEESKGGKETQKQKKQSSKREAPKTIVDHSDLVRSLQKIRTLETPPQQKHLKRLVTSNVLDSLATLMSGTRFQQLLQIHNLIQSVQGISSPSGPLCSDSKTLAEQCVCSLQSLVQPEAAEVLQLLQKVQLENLLIAHDKLAQRYQSVLPWEKCLSDILASKDSHQSKEPIDESIAGSEPANFNTPSSSTAAAVAPAVAGVPTGPASVSSLDRKSINAGSGSRSGSRERLASPGASVDVSMADSRTVDGPTGDKLSEIAARVVKITKQNEPLGATVRNEGEKVVIGRVVKGGAAERSGQLHPGDEVLEVNGLKLKGRSVHDICDTLCQMTGTLTFVIVPVASFGTDGKRGETSALDEQQQVHNVSEERKDANSQQDEVVHYRAHFNYNPDDDLYIPCHELGISFQKGDILHVINRDDQHWWQAYRDGEWTQTLAGLIPSLALQQHRISLQRLKREQDLREQRELEKSHSPSRKKSSGTSSGPSGASTGSSLLCARKSNKRKKTGSPFKKAERFDISPYEEMSLYYPQPNQKRPLILVGPPSIGRHELRLRLLEDTTRFAAAVPHTSRPRGEGEIDGQDYHFVSRSQFEEYVASKRFVEHGEFEKQYYGTSLDSIRTVINSGKTCVLNLQPGSLPILYDSDLKPYVVFLTPPSLHVYRQQRNKYGGEVMKEEDYKDAVSIAGDMEEHYGHYFDSVIPFDNVDYVFDQLIYEVNLLEREPQWVPAKWTRGLGSH